MAYIVSSIPPFYSNNTSAPSPFYPSYISPFYPSYITHTPPSPNHFYSSEVTPSNLSASYYNYGSEGYSSYHSNYPIFDGKEDAYGWVLCIEKHFKENSTPEAMKLPEAVLALSGLPRQWYFWWSQNHPSASWEVFVAAFIWRFKPEFRDVLPISDHEEEPTSFENHVDISEKGFTINSKPPQPTEVTPRPLKDLKKQQDDVQEEKSDLDEILIVGNSQQDQSDEETKPGKEEEQRDDELFLPLISTEVVSHGVEIFWAEQPPPPPLPEPPDGENPCEPHPPPKPSDRVSISPSLPPLKPPESVSISPSLPPLKPPERVWISPPLPSKPPDLLLSFVVFPPQPPPKPPDIASVRCILSLKPPHIYTTPSLNNIIWLPPPPKSLDLKFHDFITECMFEQHHKSHTAAFDFLILEFQNYKKLEPLDPVWLNAAQSHPCDKSTICVPGKEPLVSHHVSYQKSLDALHQPLPSTKFQNLCQLSHVFAHAFSPKWSIKVQFNFQQLPSQLSLVATILQVIDGKQIPIDNATHALKKSVPIADSIMEEDNYSSLSFMLNLEHWHMPCNNIGFCQDWPTDVANIKFLVILHKLPTHSMSCNMLSIHAQPDSRASSTIGFFSKSIGMEHWDPGGQHASTMIMIIPSSQFKQWEPGENVLTTMASSSQFKQWDPGKFVITFIFLQP